MGRIEFKAAMTPKGNWTSDKQCEELDVLSHHGSSWICLKPCTGVEPGTDPEYWQINSEKGEKGDPLTYADLTQAQKDDLAQGATAAAQAAADAAEDAQDAAEEAAGHLQAIRDAIDDLDPSQSPEDAVVALAARQGVLEGDLSNLGHELNKIEVKELTKSGIKLVIDLEENKLVSGTTQYVWNTQVSAGDKIHISASESTGKSFRYGFTESSPALNTPVVSAGSTSAANISIDIVAPVTGWLVFSHGESYYADHQVTVSESRLDKVESSIEESNERISDVEDDVAALSESFESVADTVDGYEKDLSARSYSAGKIWNISEGTFGKYSSSYETNAAVDRVAVKKGTVVQLTSSKTGTAGFIYLVNDNNVVLDSWTKGNNASVTHTYTAPSDGWLHVNRRTDATFSLVITKGGLPEEINKVASGFSSTVNRSLRVSMFDYQDTTIKSVSDITSSVDAVSRYTDVMSDIYGIFDGLVSAFPNVVTKQDAGVLLSMTYPEYANMDGAESEYGIATPTYRTYLYTISVGASANLPKKKLLLIGGTHGLEYMGAIDLAVLATRLCNLTDDNMAKMLMYYDIYIVPCLNGFGMINRKRYNGNKVDINRNFPTEDWAISGAGTAQYSGPSAGSEFETQLVMGLVELLSPDFLLDHHNYDEMNNYQFYSKVPDDMVGASKSAKADVVVALLRDYPQYYGTLNTAFARGLMKRSVSPSQESTPGAMINWGEEEDIPSVLIEVSSVINYTNGAYGMVSGTTYKSAAKNIAYHTLERQLLRYVECVL